MNLLPKFLRKKTYPPSDDYWYMPVRTPTQAGVEVDEFSALNYSAVYNAINIISGTIGSLPLNLYRRNGKKTEIQHNKLHDILHSAPNPNSTAVGVREATAAHVVGWGNCYLEKVFNAAGEVVELWPIAPNRVVPKIQAGAIVYEIKLADGQTIIMPRASILHVPGLGFDGINGYSVIAKARESIALGLATEQFGARFFGEGTHPGVVVEHPGKLGQDASENLKKSLSAAHSGLGKSHKLLLLEEGMKLNALGVPPNDAQFLETRQFSVVEIARWFNIDPSKLKDHTHSTFSNIEHLAIDHVVDCIRPWLVRFEQNYNIQLLTPRQRAMGFYFEHVIEGLLRGDSQSRAEFYSRLFNIGAMSINEIRAKENMNPIDGGEIHMVPLNMVPLAIALNPPEPQPIEPEPEPLPEPEPRQLLLESRSIKDRDLVSRQYLPLFVEAARTLINSETKRLKTLFDKNRKTRSAAGDLIEKMRAMYKDDFNAKMRDKVLPLIMSYGDAMQAAAAREIGLEPGMTPDIEKLLHEYVDGYVARHGSRSMGQLEALLLEDDGLDLADQRLDEWRDKRPDKIASEETVRAGSFVVSMVFFAAGFRNIWRIRGAETCPYCTSLAGKTISRGQYYLPKGAEVEPKGADGKMLIRHNIANPPLHAGCDCYVGPIK